MREGSLSAAQSHEAQRNPRRVDAVTVSGVGFRVKNLNPEPEVASPQLLDTQHIWAQVSKFGSLLAVHFHKGPVLSRTLLTELREVLIYVSVF